MQRRGEIVKGVGPDLNPIATLLAVATRLMFLLRTTRSYHAWQGPSYEACVDLLH